MGERERSGAGLSGTGSKAVPYGCQAIAFCVRCGAGHGVRASECGGYVASCVGRGLYSMDESNSGVNGDGVSRRFECSEVAGTAYRACGSAMHRRCIDGVSPHAVGRRMDGARAEHGISLGERQRGRRGFQAASVLSCVLGGENVSSPVTRSICVCLSVVWLCLWCCSVLSCHRAGLAVNWMFTL